MPHVAAERREGCVFTEKEWKEAVKGEKSKEKDNGRGSKSSKYSGFYSLYA